MKGIPSLLLMATALAASACAPVNTAFRGSPAVQGEPSASAPPHQPPPPATPTQAPPGAKGDSVAWKQALEASGDRIIVSREERRVWLMRGDSTVFAAPVAVGRETIFEYAGKAYDFSTPSGKMVVQGKEEQPDWVPPDWHYFEKAVEQGLEPVHLKANDRVELSDGTVIEVRKGEVGRVNTFGNWRAFTPGSEIIYDDKIFIPPFGSSQRRIPKILGTHRLILGDGYLIHGTPDTESIGEYASHGCVRMFNHDVEQLYGMVKTGVPVYIY